MVTVVKMRMCTVHMLHMHTKNYSLSTYTQSHSQMRTLNSTSLRRGLYGYKS